METFNLVKSVRGRCEPRLDVANCTFDIFNS